MTIIFITGLSGVGKTSVLERLKKDGYNVIDTDYGYITIKNTGGVEERVWDEDKIKRLLNSSKEENLFLSGCYSNQGKFYSYFEHVVLLKADLNVMLERINKRRSHDYGKSEEERSEIMDSYEHVLPLLETRSDVIIDTTHSDIETVCNRLKELVSGDLRNA
ncbi:AAA family ATPase [Alteribacter aurantiacus]|uniref:AAA family ATPase n=1 Tax=Alteribacter aurantiacus TaxID=254410 RepID=UPI00042715F0|nr:AAA family ATPase [Alteribacter aurantiacus]